MSISPADIIDLNENVGQKTTGYQNSLLTKVNDHVVRMSIMTEDFYWHYHPNSDETFLVIDGTLLLDFEGSTIALTKGQMITIPANIAHRTRPKEIQSINLTIERAAMETIRLETTH